METLTKVKKGEMNFDMEAFSNISEEAKDFIAKLLVFKVSPGAWGRGWQESMER